MIVLSTALAVVLFALPMAATAAAPLPFGDGEALHYTIIWPSGLDLGEATMTATRDEGSGQWSFDFKLDAAVPGYHIKDHYHSTATAELCSIEFLKESNHGKRKTSERTTFDQQAHRAHRVTLTKGGGESDLETPECARDALTFLYYLRQELSLGRIPASPKVLFGSLYDVKFQPAGSKKVRVGGKIVEADQMMVSVKGPASESMFILLVARDKAHTPVRITVPLEPGNFTMRLAQE